jgi:hypothetical protein
MRLSAALAVVSLSAQEGRQPLARAILKELIEINTTDWRATPLAQLKFRRCGFAARDSRKAISM